MKKLSKYFLIGAILCLPLFAMGSKAFAADAAPTPCPSSLDSVSGSFTNHICSANDLIFSVINILFGILGLVSALFIIIGGFKYVMSQGNDKAVESAKKTITYAAVGLALAILAYTIVAIVVNTVGAPGAATTTGTTTTPPAGNGGNPAGGTTTASCDSAGAITFKVTPQNDPAVPPEISQSSGSTFNVAVKVSNPDITAGKCDINMQIIDDNSNQTIVSAFNGVTSIDPKNLPLGVNLWTLNITNKTSKQIIGTTETQIQVDP